MRVGRVEEPRGELQAHLAMQSGCHFRGINLCNCYVWRWNVSADYDDQGKLLQAY